MPTTSKSRWDKWNKAHPGEAKKQKKEWRENNLDHVKKKWEEWYAGNKDRRTEYMRTYRANKRRRTEELNHKHKLKKYGLTIEEYDQMLSDQKGGCAICGKPPGRRMLSVDHNHQTGEVRGLLCSNCNTAIGLLDDNTETLESAIAYIKMGKPEAPVVVATQ